MLKDLGMWTRGRKIDIPEWVLCMENEGTEVGRARCVQRTRRRLANTASPRVGPGCEIRCHAVGAIEFLRRTGTG